MTGTNAVVAVRIERKHPLVPRSEGGGTVRATGELAHRSEFRSEALTAVPAGSVMYGRL